MDNTEKECDEKRRTYEMAFETLKLNHVRFNLIPSDAVSSSLFVLKRKTYKRIIS